MNPLTPNINGKKPATNAARVGNNGEQQRSGGIIVLNILPAVDEFLILILFLNAYTEKGKINERKNAKRKANNVNIGVINWSDIIPILPPV